jgi:hypothetical protein
MTDASEHLKLRPTALEWREIEGEVVAVDLQKSVYLAANRSGAVLWPALAEGTTRAELVTRLADQFDLDRDRAAADVDAFVGALAEQGLLENE